MISTLPILVASPFTNTCQRHLLCSQLETYLPVQVYKWTSINSPNMTSWDRNTVLQVCLLHICHNPVLLLVFHLLNPWLTKFVSKFQIKLKQNKIYILLVFFQHPIDHLSNLNRLTLREWEGEEAKRDRAPAVC